MKTRGLKSRIWMVCLVACSLTLIASAQKGGTGTGGTGTGSTGSRSSSAPLEPPPSFGFDANRPVYVSGKVAMAGGGPVPESVVIQRVCGGNIQREATTDSNGSFSFLLGDRVSNFQDASEGGTVRSVTRSNTLTTRDIQNCEIRAVLPGYLSTSISLAGRSITDMPNIGTIVLSKASSGPGDSISATSYAAPPDAKKAYSKGNEDFEKKKYKDAEKQLARAVEIYPAYAMAWDLLGRTQDALKRPEDARKSFEAAVKADDKFVLPYLRMAVMASNKPDWEEVLRQTEKVVALDPISYPYAYYLRGAAFFNTGHLAEAEEASLRAVEVDRQHKFPRTELLAGTVLAKKGDHAAAIAHFQQFLRLEPKSPEAPSIQKYIDSQSAVLAPSSKQ